MSRFYFLILLFASHLISGAQTFHPKIQSKLDGMNSSVSWIQSLQSFGIKTPGSQASDTTQKWIISQLNANGYSDITVDTFTRNGVLYTNIITSKESSLSDEYFIVCAHYDTRNGPGASDNGSGVAALLQTSKLIKDLNITRSVVFIFFDGEEAGYVGSQSYVSRFLSSLDPDLYMVLNVDQIGGTAGEPGNDKIKCERDENTNPLTNNGLSYTITDTIARLATIYTSLEPIITKAYASDYIPFEEAGYVITGLYQNADDKYSHSAADTIGNLDTVAMNEAIKLTAAATMYFAQIDAINSVKIEANSLISVYPNPARSLLHYSSPDVIEKVVIKNCLGQIVFEDLIMSAEGEINVPQGLKGLYLVAFYGIQNSKTITKKINFVAD